jgi:hypothetical protein
MIMCVKKHAGYRRSKIQSHVGPKKKTSAPEQLGTFVRVPKLQIDGVSHVDPLLEIELEPPENYHASNQQRLLYQVALSGLVEPSFAKLLTPLHFASKPWMISLSPESRTTFSQMR